MTSASGRADSNALGLGDLTAKAHARDLGRRARCLLLDRHAVAHLRRRLRCPLHTVGPLQQPGGALAYLGENFDFKGDGCDINDYSRIPGDRRSNHGGRAPAGRPLRVRRAAGQKVTIVLLHGQTGSPGAILHGPAGQTIDAPEPGPKARTTGNRGPAAPANETEIQIAGPPRVTGRSCLPTGSTRSPRRTSR